MTTVDACVKPADLNRRLVRVAWTLAIVAIALGGCSNSPSGPERTPVDDSTLLLDKLLVSVVPGGQETVLVKATDADGAPLVVTVDNDAPGIVSAALSDSVLEVTGLELGTAHLTLTSTSGRTRVLPVQVYSQYVLDLGEMYLTYADTFAITNWCSYAPIGPAGFHPLGDMFGPDIPLPPVEVNGYYAAPMLKPKPGSDAIRFTHQFSGPGYPYAVAWTPIAPAGYVALGTFSGDAYHGLAAPDSALCIRDDLATIAPLGPLARELHLVSPGDYMLRYYPFDTPEAGPHPGAYLPAGTYINLLGGEAVPADHPAGHILDVELPTLAVAANQEVAPRLTGYETPPEYTAPMMARAMLVPCTILSDPRYSQNLRWQVANSPFYRLERQVYYKRIYFNWNNTSAQQTNSVLIRSGITTTESERVWSESKISVSAKLGLSIKALSGKISVTVSRTMGYETQTSVAELTEKEVTTSVNTPPYKAAAAWQQVSRFILYRHNGTELEPVTSWEVGIDSYVTDEYPD